MSFSIEKKIEFLKDACIILSAHYDSLAGGPYAMSTETRVMYREKCDESRLIFNEIYEDLKILEYTI